MPDPQRRVLTEAEFNAARDRALRTMPANLTEAEFTRLIGSYMEQEIAKAEYGPAAVEGSPVRRFLSNAGEMVNPVSMVKGVYESIKSPEAVGKTVEGIWNASKAQGSQALQAAREGRYVEAAGHALGTVPIIGPAAAAAGEQAATGDVAGGLGKGTGLVASMLVPSAAVRAVRNPATAARAETSAASRVVDVMTPKVGPNKLRFGGMAEKAAPQIAKDLAAEGAPWTREGLHTRVGAKLADAERALDVAEDARLSARTFPTQPLIDELLKKRKALTAETVEGSRPIPSYVGPGRASGTLAGSAVDEGSIFKGTTDAELFNEALAEARRLGYEGTQGGFRVYFEQALDKAKDLHAEMVETQASFGKQAILKEIAKAGGIGADAGYPGEIRHLWESTSATAMQVGKTKAGRATWSRTGRGEIAGVPGVLKKGGKTLDEIAEYLRQDPRFEHIAGPNDVLAAIDEARAAGPQAPRLTESLNVVGLRPGVKWWEGEQVAAVVDDVDAPLDAGLRRVARPIGQDVVPAPDARRAGVIDQAVEELKALGPVTRYESIRRMRQAYDQPAKARYSPSMTTDYLKVQGDALGAADVTGTLRETMAKWDPQTAAANAQYSLYRRADDVLEAAAEVERVRPKVGRMIVARLTGASVGAHAGGVPGAVAGYVFAPAIEAASSLGVTTQLKTAALLQRLADAIRKGDVGAVTSLSSQLKRIGATSAAVQGTTTSPSGSQGQTTTPALSTP